MKLLSPAISRFARLRLWSVEQWRTDPVATQYNVWQDLLAAGQYTEYGRQHGFSAIQSLKQWKEQVPLTQYEDLKPWIDRMLQGEEQLLWNTPVGWFAKSSGTTSDKSKFIPVSDESLKDNHYKASKDVLTMYYAAHPDSDLLTGKGLIIGGSHQVSQLNDDIQYGDLSAVVVQNSPFWSNWLRTPELPIILMDEWEAKIEKLAQHTIHENVTSMAGVPTWLMVLLRRILELTGKSTIKEVWPSLELYMHGGVSFVPYRKAFEELIGAPINYLEMYNASEGFFAAQDDINAEGMLLMLDHGIFYEFIPAGEWDAPQPRTLQLDEVELGRQYALVITTNGGLWRYLPGDTVQFTSLSPFRVRVSGRMKHFINAFGEELIIDNADKAIAAACRATGLTVNDYTAAPVYFSGEDNGAHEWLIEFQQVPEDIAPFADALDAALKEANSDYEAKRHKDIALRGPQIVPVPAGSFERWLESKGKLGGQHKVPRLSNDRRVLEEVAAFLGRATEA
ncbi:GH3 auxin-responsive promoter family protein [Flaviaesturariibacter flavus]|uniref:GH3 auxin-responsive promoter family protein n=1 Tax=Flaviaesturariibacter flavus TaxID=2502780 RepID=A0A4R1B4U3_9BACT|nr:GH3 auxin-responsive promoter family protein [Flaviaesturariibacter flavus]TCJ13134.1 GH3 auxin-responsive promoter family protein [Flaviaesturariibacter flavus]